MKHFALTAFLFLLICQSSLCQMGIGTTTPDSSAVLDVFSTNKGFLPPRIALTATNISQPIDNPATGLLIYNTATAGSDSVKVMPGYYYWDGAKWFALSRKGEARGEMLYWTGNQWTAIPPGTNGAVLTMCNGVPKWGSCNDSIVISSSPNSGQSTFVTYNDADPAWANGNLYSNASVLPELAAATSPSGAGYGTVTSRSFLAFDLNSLPPNAQIISAKLSLYGLPASNAIPQGNQGANNLLVQRVVDNWDQTTVTWNTQPATTTTGQVELPQTTATFNYDVTNIDVTQLIRDMRTLTPNKTAGFCLRLKTEALWRSVIFASTHHAMAAKRPTLKIVYQ
ncbi:MAG: DNRLRE domain-containing protein [Chitinophagaceae bacterium]|nr:MAG: DNRLRE domain-containing protein [Chitinophagaceae bacterium]